MSHHPINRPHAAIESRLYSLKSVELRLFNGQNNYRLSVTAAYSPSRSLSHSYSVKMQILQAVLLMILIVVSDAQGSHCTNPAGNENVSLLFYSLFVSCYN